MASRRSDFARAHIKAEGVIIERFGRTPAPLRDGLAKLAATKIVHDGLGEGEAVDEAISESRAYLEA